MLQDTSSNGVAGGTVAEVVSGGAGIDTSDADTKARAERAATITRRGRLLVLLDEAASDGLTLDALFQRLVVDHPEATAQTTRLDLELFISAGVGERRAPSEPKGAERYALTLRGEKDLETLKWTKLATRITDDEQKPKPADTNDATAPAPTRPQDGSTTWAQAAQASAEKEAQEKAAKGKGRKKDKGASAQLGLGSGPGRFTMDLPCTLPEDELAALRKEHLDLCDQRDAIKERKSAAMKAFAAEIEMLDENELNARKRLQAAEAGKSTRPVECEKRLDGTTMRFYRTDTGEALPQLERAATIAELEAANPPPPTTPVPEEGEVRGADKGADSQAKDTDTGKPKAKGKGGRKPRVVTAH